MPTMYKLITSTTISKHQSGWDLLKVGHRNALKGKKKKNRQGFRIQIQMDRFK